MSAEQRVKELGLELPAATSPKAHYANAARTGNLLFLAGKAPLPESGRVPKGRFGREYTASDGYRFTRSTRWRASSKSRASSTPCRNSRTTPR